MPSQKNDSIKRAEKKMKECSYLTTRVQFENGSKDSYMVGPNGAENVRLLGLNYSHNGKQIHYTYGENDESPRLKLAYNQLTQNVYMVFGEGAMEIFVLNNKERSAFEGFIIVTWISLYSNIIYTVILMGNGDDFSLFQGKCNGTFGKQIQSGIQNLGEKFLAYHETNLLSKQKN